MEEQHSFFRRAFPSVPRVSNNGMTSPFKMAANLMFSARLQGDMNEGIASPVLQPFVVCDSFQGLPSPGVAQRAFPHSPSARHFP